MAEPIEHAALSIQSARDFSRAAPSYDSHARLQRNVTKQLWKRYGSYADNAGILLDAGCGTGMLASMLEQEEFAGTLLQLDIAEAMCRKAVSYSPVINANICQLPVHNESIHTVFSSLALQWVSPLSAALSELHHVCIPGGHAILSTLLPGTLHELDISFRHAGYEQAVQPFLTAENVIETAHRTGWEIVDSHEAIMPLAFNSPEAVMHHLKGLGATRKGKRSRTLTKTMLATMKSYYREHYSTAQEVTASFNVLMLLLKKP
jgi:malonyl-CoA O-methyltransferase